MWGEAFERFHPLIEGLGAKHSLFLLDLDHTILFASPHCDQIFAMPSQNLLGKTWTSLPLDESSLRQGESAIEKVKDQLEPVSLEITSIHPDGSEHFFEAHVGPILENGRLVCMEWTCYDISSYKLSEKALEKRLYSMTQPLAMATVPEIEELFDIADLQKLQDDFALASGVASIITKVDGTPVTRHGSFTRFCNMVRCTPKGCANCQHSDAVLGKLNVKTATVQACLSGGLWDAGAGISVGGVHIANWLIGQVREESQSDEKIRVYARHIVVNEDELVAAYQQIPAMSEERFRNTARALHTLATQLSTLAYQNLQQARFITERKRVERMLSDYSKELEQLVYVASHDLRSPLVNIRGFAQELEESLQSLEHLFTQKEAAKEALAEWAETLKEADEQLRMVKTSAEHLSDLLNGLLQVSRTRHENLNLDQVDIQGLLLKLKDSFAFECGRLGAEIRLASTLPSCYGDSLQISRVFSNLIANALKFRSPQRP